MDQYEKEVILLIPSLILLNNQLISFDVYLSLLITINSNEINSQSRPPPRSIPHLRLYCVSTFVDE